jgi:hypothetical protein
MLHRVPLSHLPAGVEFPPALAGKISYDAERKQLCFDGFMSKGDFDRLSHLSNEVAYLKALEDLFRVAIYRHDPPASPSLGKSLVAMAKALRFW